MGLLEFSCLDAPAATLEFLWGGREHRVSEPSSDPSATALNAITPRVPGRLVDAATRARKSAPLAVRRSRCVSFLRACDQPAAEPVEHADEAVGDEVQQRQGGPDVIPGARPLVVVEANRFLRIQFPACQREGVAPRYLTERMDAEGSAGDSDARAVHWATVRECLLMPPGCPTT